MTPVEAAGRQNTCPVCGHIMDGDWIAGLLADLQPCAEAVAAERERIMVALAKLDAPLDWDRESPDDRIVRFVAEIRAIVNPEAEP